jgi:integrase/recombinase XerD
MLNLWRRHLKSCPHTSTHFRRCKCPVWVMGTFEGEFIRKSLNTTSWERGTAILREWDDSANIETFDVGRAGERFLEDGKSRQLSTDTLNKYRLMFREMTAFFGKKDLRSISVDDLSAYRSSWKMAPITSLKKLERLKAFFGFCKARGWVKENRAVFLKTPKATFTPTLPFTEAEFEKTMWATEVFPTKGIYGKFNQTRLSVFIRLLRYTGLRIRDAVMLKRSDVSFDNGTWRVFLYQQKTGQPVYIPIPAQLGECLEAMGKIDNRTTHIFWSGLGNPKSCVGDWQRSLRRLFTLAGIKNGHAHRFRDTFSISLLEKGIPIETVSILLGHTNIKTTQKHYAPWIQSRQDALEAAVKKTWA